VPVPGGIVGAAYVELGYNALSEMAMGAPVPEAVTEIGEGVTVWVMRTMLVRLRVVDVVFKAVSVHMDVEMLAYGGRGRLVAIGAEEFAPDGTGTPVLNGKGFTENHPVMLIAVGRMLVDVEFAGYGGRIDIADVGAGTSVTGPVEKGSVVALIAVDKLPTGRMDIMSPAGIEVVAGGSTTSVEGVGVT
jgi:hypothetical protein